VVCPSVRLHPAKSIVAGFLCILESPETFSLPIFKTFKILENRVGAWRSLNLSYYALESPGIFLACDAVIVDTVIVNDDHLVTGILRNLVLLYQFTLSIQC